MLVVGSVQYRGSAWHGGSSAIGTNCTRSWAQARSAGSGRPGTRRWDWIDLGSAYTPNFIDLAGDRTLRTQNTLADLSGITPAENAAANPATRQLVDLYAKYAPGAKITLPAVKAFSAWLLFAESAADCGDDLTRKCAYDAAVKEKSWTGGGLQAPVDLSDKDRRVTCFNVMQATADGWTSADFNIGPSGRNRRGRGRDSGGGCHRSARTGHPRCRVPPWRPAGLRVGRLGCHGPDDRGRGPGDAIGGPGTDVGAVEQPAVVRLDRPVQLAHVPLNSDETGAEPW